jgi:hypothetical protein
MVYSQTMLKRGITGTSTYWDETIGRLFSQANLITADILVQTVCGLYMKYLQPFACADYKDMYLRTLLGHDSRQLLPNGN